uniref:acylphosphatase n=1 Tax=Cacopsylla melanoneura TaxID=428564 RepID=A0A8D9BVW4_9HEMI
MLLGCHLFNLIFIFALVLQSTPTVSDSSNAHIKMSTQLSVEFEVFGKVQRVAFRKYTQKKAVALGLTGWCQNTSHETVIGVVQGPKDAVEEMKEWLQTMGSPSSRIDHVVFKNESTISFTSYTHFDIRP